MNRQTLFLVVIILLLIGGGYYLYTNFGTAGGELDASISTPYTAEIATKLIELEKVKNVSLNFAVFEGKLFTSLRSAGQVATSTMSRGRVNPFLPL